MVESIMKRTMSENDYDNAIERTKETINKFEKIIEFHKDLKPCKIFKKKMIRYEWELNELYDRKKYWEDRLEELEYEKRRLY